MLLDIIKEKFNSKSSQRNIKQKKNLKKTLSDLNIKIKANNYNNVLPTTNLSTTNRFSKKVTANLFHNILQGHSSSSQLSNSLRSSLFKNSAISTRNIFQKYMNKKLFTAKTAREMEDKFYLRHREGANDLDKNFNLFDTVIKSHGKIVKKIFFDYKNIQNFNKEVLNTNISNYKRNLEFIENQDKVKEFQVLRASHKFERLRNYQYRKSLFSSQIRTPIASKRPSLFPSPKYKPPLVKKVSKNSDKFDKLEQKVRNVLLQKKYVTLKKLKINSKKFCEEVENLDKECKLYEPINDHTSKLNLQNNNFYNIGNLDRIVKLSCLKDDRYINDDYEKNRPFLKKCYKEYNFECDKAISGYFPSFAKSKNFLQSTMIKFAHLQGKYFGLPV